MGFKIVGWQRAEAISKRDQKTMEKAVRKLAKEMRRSDQYQHLGNNREDRVALSQAALSLYYERQVAHGAGAAASQPSTTPAQAVAAENQRAQASATHTAAMPEAATDAPASPAAPAPWTTTAPSNRIVGEADAVPSLGASVVNAAIGGVRLSGEAARDFVLPSGQGQKVGSDGVAPGSLIKESAGRWWRANGKEAEPSSVLALVQLDQDWVVSKSFQPIAAARAADDDLSAIRKALNKPQMRQQVAAAIQQVSPATAGQIQQLQAQALQIAMDRSDLRQEALRASEMASVLSHFDPLFGDGPPNERRGDGAAPP